MCILKKYDEANNRLLGKGNVVAINPHQNYAVHGTPRTQNTFILCDDTLLSEKTMKRAEETLLSLGYNLKDGFLYVGSTITLTRLQDEAREKVPVSQFSLSIRFRC